jgi:hypothetical protein
MLRKMSVVEEFQKQGILRRMTLLREDLGATLKRPSNHMTDIDICTGTSLLTEYFVLEYPS